MQCTIYTDICLLYCLHYIVILDIIYIVISSRLSVFTDTLITFSVIGNTILLDPYTKSID